MENDFDIETAEAALAAFTVRLREADPDLLRDFRRLLSGIANEQIESTPELLASAIVAEIDGALRRDIH